MNDKSNAKPRVQEPQRKQGVIRFEIPEDALEAMHPARVLWDVTGTLDLGAFLFGAKSVEGTVGRKTLSPRMKLVLWLYAISEGIGSAREIERRTESDAAYRWLVGDLAVGHHTLSSFRVEHGAALDQLMTDILAALMHKGVLSLDLIAQDGIRIRAAATAPSFRTYGSLLECREQAALHLKAVLAQADDSETNVGSDMGSITPMLEEVERRTGALPKVLLADANHASHDCIRAATAKGIEVLVAVPERSQQPGANADTHPDIVAWRARMQTDDAKRLYRARAASAN